MSQRQLLRVHPARREDIGDLVTRRPLAPAETLDPFLFINHHGPQLYKPHNQGLPFGPHPHRGFETVTFILAGELAHRDSSGHESIIHAGGVQWMTAGRGIVHAEQSPAGFKEAGGPLEILQLWVNLPARLKMTEPAYFGMEADDIPVVDRKDARISLVAGTLDDCVGRVATLTGLFLSVVRLDGGASIELPAPAGRTVFLYVVAGEVDVGGTPIWAYNLAELGDGESVAIEARTDAVLIFGHGAPYHEPIVAHGPFVMNRREEIVEAIADYQAGRLGALT